MLALVLNCGYIGALTDVQQNNSFAHTTHDVKIMAPLCVLVLAIIIVGTTILPLQALNAQKMTIKMNNATSSSSGSNDNDTVSKSVIATLAKPGYGYKYDVSVKESTVHINESRR